MIYDDDDDDDKMSKITHIQSIGTLLLASVIIEPPYVDCILLLHLTLSMLVVRLHAEPPLVWFLDTLKNKFL